MRTRKRQIRLTHDIGPQQQALERWLLESAAPALDGCNRTIPGFFRLLQCNGDEDLLSKAYEGRRRLGGW